MRIISGFLGGRILKTSEGKGYRPAMGKVREALFSMLEAQEIDWENTKVIDVYAGTGSLAFEAISRGAQAASCIEIDKKAVECLHHNISNFNIQDKCFVLQKDARKFFQQEAHAQFDLIFIDPPYGEKKFYPTLLSMLKNNWLADSAFLVAEVEAGLKLETEIEQLELLVDRTYGQTRILLWKKM